MDGPPSPPPPPQSFPPPSFPPPDHGLPVPIPLLLGPILVGSLLSWALFGTLSLQTYLYYRWYSDDGCYLKTVVAILFILEVIEMILATHATWIFMVSGWGKPGIPLSSPWSICTAIALTGIIASVSQTFFARRLWRLTHSLALVLVILTLSLAQCVASITGAVEIIVADYQNSTELSTFEELSIWLACSAVCDIAIAIGMIYHLRRTKTDIDTRTADFLLTRLITFSIRTGTITAICAALTLCLSLTFKKTDLEDIPFFILAKIYSNTVLANLNARSSLSSDVLAVKERGDFIFAINGVPETEDITRQMNEGQGSNSIPVSTMSRISKDTEVQNEESPISVKDTLQRVYTGQLTV